MYEYFAVKLTYPQKASLLWEIMPCSSLKLTHVSGENAASILRVEE
jgi:hypothetical protein